MSYNCNNQFLKRTCGILCSDTSIFKVLLCHYFSSFTLINVWWREFDFSNLSFCLSVHNIHTFNHDYKAMYFFCKKKLWFFRIIFIFFAKFSFYFFREIFALFYRIFFAKFSHFLFRETDWRNIIKKMEWRAGRLYRRWNEGREDYIEDRMKGGKIIWKMEWRDGRLYGRWSEGKEDYMEDGKKGRKIIWKMEWWDGRLYGKWNEGREDYIEDRMKGWKII